MKNLIIHKKIVLHSKSSKGGGFFASAVFIIVCILCSPLILVVWLAMLLSNAQSEKNFIKKESIDNWFLIDISIYAGFSLSYTLIDPSSISEAATGFFEYEQLYIYKTVPHINFFAGYFTDFKMEQPDGIFVQKVYFNDTLEEIVSMPLFFFNYQTAEAKEIHDLKEYVLLDRKGNLNDFLITASGEEHDLEIRIIRS